MANTDKSDGELMAEFAATLDPEVFETLVARYHPSAVAVARGRLSDRSLAEDAAQEAFLRVARSCEAYDPSRAFAAWFYTILKNTCHDLSRKTRREQRKSERLLAESAADSTVAPPPEPADTFDEIVAGLAEDEREILLCRFVHEMPFREIAAALGISEDAAKKRSRRALAKLRGKI